MCIVLHCNSHTTIKMSSSPLPFRSRHPQSQRTCTCHPPPKDDQKLTFCLIKKGKVHPKHLLSSGTSEAHLSSSVAVALSPKGLAPAVQSQSPDLRHSCKASLWHQYGVHTRSSCSVTVPMTNAGGCQVSGHQGRRTGSIGWHARPSQAKGV